MPKCAPIRASAALIRVIRRLWIGEEAVAYRDLVLACGAEAIRVPVAGDAAEAIFPINDLEDYTRFRARRCRQAARAAARRRPDRL